MALTNGVRLGPYEILSAIGAGGMGEVYKARDTRLDRTVAIKILPPALAADAQFRERFDREARAVSHLNHPNICTLFDVGQQDDHHFIVMEFLDGESLADRLAREKDHGLPLPDALRIAVEIGSALDAAHRAGIVHRDLKPGNIVLTKGGAKLLDFGLAKTGVAAVSASGGTMMPTTPANITAQGTILGTFQYMAPEQLEGDEADARTDLFAFGAVLYEMLTGRKAFAGKSHASLISAIMSVTPQPIAALQPTSPAALDRIIARCLAKDPGARWQCAADLVVQLTWLAEDDARGVSVNAASATASSARVTPRARRAQRVWMAAALAFGTLAVALGAQLWRRPVPIEEATQFAVLAPPKQILAVPPGLMSVSPDGRHVAFFTQGGSGGLWVRSFDASAAKRVPGTEGGWQPFWSPDGRWVAFVVASKLKKIDVSGGPSRTLADSNGERGAWSSKDVIVFGGTDGRLYQMPASGGQPRPVTELDKSRGETAHSWPAFLPDGRRFVFLAKASKPENRALYLASLDAPGRTRLVDAFSSVEYGSGHLLYQRDGVLLAHPFDDKAGRLAGEPVPIVENLDYNPINGRAAFSVAASTLVYRANESRRLSRLAWFDRAGKATGSAGEVTVVSSPRLSPDGGRIVVAQADAQKNEDVWQIDVARHVSSRFTFDPAREGSPVWSPDGRWIVFSSDRKGQSSLFRRAADGSGADELLSESPELKTATDWSPDGKIILFSNINTASKTGFDIFALPLEGRKPFPVVQSASEDEGGAFSPDGRWIVYESEESGSDQVYVQPFPPTGAKWQLSTTDGGNPRWSRDGKEIFYGTADSRLMTVDVGTVDGRFQPGSPRELFAAPLTSFFPFFDVTRDGQRFLVLTKSDEAIDTPLTVIINWPASLKK